MGKILIKAILCGLALLCASCFTEEDFGFPKTVTFTSEGGVQDITGDRHIGQAFIKDYKTGESGSGGKNEDGMEYNELDWLKIEHQRLDDGLRIIAEPNTSGKSRKLYIELYSCQKYQVVKVVQNR